MKQQLSKLGVWFPLDAYSAADAAQSAKRIEKLGYSALWLMDSAGRDPMVLASWLLAKTNALILATGIANIYNREPGVMLAAQQSLAEQSGGRFLLGLGVSHKMVVEGLRKLKYGPPLTTMKTYLESMENSIYTGPKPESPAPTVIAALGPKMLELAAEKCQGAHPYFVSPEHTAMARKIMGPDAWLCVEQKVVMETDPTKARALARDSARIYLRLPNYRNNWKRMGLTEEDLQGGGSNRFIDSTFAWGTVDNIKDRLRQHLDAGASHICIQPVNPSDKHNSLHWETLEALAP